LKVTHFRETVEGRAFVASADSRETSHEVMEAIAYFALHLADAEAIWMGDFSTGACNPAELWERVTQNEMLVANSFFWGGRPFGDALKRIR
jgi:uncharacterized damage-inducible protein DinB